jgi:hypothetical protein
MVLMPSLQLPKHLGRLKGVPAFTALHTCVNEYGEIRSMILTPTKAHNQFMPALAAISESLQSYGHTPVEIVFTDNVRADKAELERVSPSLRVDIVPVPNQSTLPKISLPVEWHSLVLSTTFQVNSRLGMLLNTFSSQDGSFVAMDMEWSVDTAYGIHGRVAVITIAFGHEVLVFPVSFSG